VDLYIDNDIVFKLAEYGLLKSFRELVESRNYKIYVLDTLPYIAGFEKASVANRVFKYEGSLDSVREFFKLVSIAKISEQENLDFISRIDHPNLDAGELYLFGCVLESNQSKFLTGDKRAIVALDSFIGLKKITVNQCEIAFLELVLQAMLNCASPEDVISKVKPMEDVDSSIKLCFSNASIENLSSISAALNSYIDHLTSKCEHLNFFSPEGCQN